MAITAQGLNYIGYLLTNGNKIALGTGENSLLPVGVGNYQDVFIGGSSSEQQRGKTAAMSTSGGVITNTNRFYFNAADTNWGSISHVFIVTSTRSILYSGVINSGTPVSITQNKRPKFDEGAIRITITASGS